MGAERVGRPVAALAAACAAARAAALAGAALVAVGLAVPATAVAQPAPAYLDPVAATLHRSASESWSALDESVVRYTALVRQRIGATLRTPLKDRSLYGNESAARVMWDRDHETLVQLLGARTRYPGREADVERRGVEAILDGFTIDGAFDPGGDRLIFGMGPAETESPSDGDDGFQIAHPLAPGADSLYRFRSGDTLVVELPDGRELRAIRLDVLPRAAHPQYLAGTLWIEPGSGALVRAAFRLARTFDAIRDVPELRAEDEAGAFRYVPELLKPWTFDLEVMVVDYAYWDFRVWLPRSARLEGVAGAGVLNFPVHFDLAYDIESVVLEDDLAALDEGAPALEERHFATRAEAMAFMAELAQERGVAQAGAWMVDGRARLRPRDATRLEAGPDLPPPIDRDAAGFPSAAEIRDALDLLADLPAPPLAGSRWTAAWGFQRPGLVRYNRVEGPALGGRVEVTTGSPVGPLAWSATGFLGLADLDPKARIGVERASLRRTIALGAFRELRPLDAGGRHLGLGNSLGALLFGRDDGEYLRATGVDIEIGPPPTRRGAWALRLFAERQEPVERATRFSLSHAFDSGWRFRPVLPADPVDEMGAELRLAPWWGSDPRATQFGAELQLRGARGRPAGARAGGAEGYDYARGALTLRASFPAAGGWRVGVEGGGGGVAGDAPLQQLWAVGGAATLRGFDATTSVGRRFLRGRLELGRQHPGWALALFGDVAVTRDRPAWSPEGAGRWFDDPERWNHDDPRWAVGVGVSVLDGLIRLDLSRGVAGPDPRTRLDLHLDAAF